MLRRAAFDRFVAPHDQPSVSVLLATRRPDMVDHALSQVARQRGVRQLELVLALHGFDIDPARAQEAVRRVRSPGPAGLRRRLRRRPQRGGRGGGWRFVLKMDDDDWYSPDFVADLLRARPTAGPTWWASRRPLLPGGP